MNIDGFKIHFNRKIEEGVKAEVKKKVVRYTKFTTQCSIVNNDSNTTLGVGASMNHPNDTPLPESGRKIALKKAMEAARLPKNVRTQIWNGYNQSKPNGRW